MTDVPATAGLGGTVAWVTGAARGMGASHARRLAALGAAVGCLDVNAAELDQVVASIRSAGGTAEAVVADVSDWDAMASAAGELRQRLGPVEIVVANAGVIPGDDPIEHLDPAEWARVIAINLTGGFHTAKAAIPQIKERGRGGAIVFIASTAGLGAGAGYGAYYASKHGVIGLMRNLANELAGDDIRVNAVCPGWVDTPMVDSQAADAGLSREEGAALFVSDHLIQRLIRPEEITDAVIWLATSEMTTGVALPVDGGLLARTFNS